ncbi:beta-ketoacyl synthase N-terminal-like domain-containing protein [Streptomyces spectabilis]|uniref:beta-ketoacyl synthase N-terminal-like domain-containing protein n=1 Tax=Streptomyces spectabilis TaxID=68270 RepID=UPI0033D968F3
MAASRAEPIAILRMRCRFPGAVESADELWRLVAEGRSAVDRAPRSRWHAGRPAEPHDPESSEQRWMEPQFRVLAEAAWPAVEHAGVPMGRPRGTRTHARAKVRARGHLPHRPPALPGGDDV